MGPITQNLLRLQEIETQLWALRESLASKTRAITAQETKIRQTQEQLDQKNDQLKHLRADADSQELDIKTQESAIGKLRNALNTAKSNREYDAILSQINSDRTEIARQEEKVLALLGQIDQMQAECRQVREDIQQSEQKLQTLRQVVQDSQARNQQKLTELENAKAELAGSIPPEVLQLFERMGENYNGQAMAAVLKNGRRRTSYSCSGCHMSITVDTVSLLMSQDQVKQCLSCQRLLYVKPE